ncbi:DUF2141 domain-containing protein [Brevundimonas sp.]|uniref:DUF2141 domain-containing protein n=1 Tax=Brevundimonas sp. TaxID=1871086 RepID=UPI0035AE63B9
MKSLACAAALALFAAPAFAQDGGHTVTLNFDVGVRDGQVMVALFDSADAWRGDRSVARAAASAAGPVVVFRDLPAGDYAVKAFHDVDGDGRMDANPFGIPTEPYAFSNNAVGNMGPASWEVARFTVSGDVAQTLRIR